MRMQLSTEEKKDKGDLYQEHLLITLVVFL